LRKKTINVRPIPNHPLWYEVESHSQKENHEVHLDANGGNGECSCEDFTFTCSENLKKNPLEWVEYGEPGNANPKRTMCKHIKAARRYLVDNTLRQAAYQLKHGK